MTVARRATTAGNATCTCGNKVTGHAHGNTSHAGPSRKLKIQKPVAHRPATARKAPGTHKPTKPTKAQHHSRAGTANQAAAHTHTNHAAAHSCHCGKPHHVKKMRKPPAKRKVGAAMRAR